jgi:uncharacterized RDD family membrane protein YckC
MARSASLPIRAAAGAIDILLIIVLMLFLGQWEVDFLPNMPSIDTNAAAVAVFLYIFWLTSSVYFLFEALAGRTVGKVLLGLRIARFGGQRAGLGRRLGRALGKIGVFLFIPCFGLLESDLLIWPFLAVSLISILGSFLILLPNRQPLYEILTRTVVVPRKKA